MYVRYSGHWDRIRCDIHKSIKIDKRTFDIIESCAGNNFSDKLRAMAYEYDSLRSKKSNTNFLQ